ncbi:hypothetical protein Tco_0422906 [Tanacetum coccineum]
MLTGKWTPMNHDVNKFNSIYNQTNLLSGENEENLYTRVLTLFHDQTKFEFRHRSSWLFLKDKYKWQNPESTQARRTRGRVTEEDLERFGDNVIPCPSGVPRKSKAQRSSGSSSATSGSSKAQIIELMQQQVLLDREAKKESMDRELAARIAMSSCVSCVRGGKQTHPSPSISSKINLGRRKMLGEMWDCQLGNLTAGKGSGGGGRDIIQICPRVHAQNFDTLPTDEDIVSFFKELGHIGEIKTITDIVVDQMHQPRRTFATIINRSLSGKTTGLDKLRLSRAQIL